MSAAGSGRDALWSCVQRGQHALAPIRRFDPGGSSAKLGGMVPTANLICKSESPPWQLCVEFAVEAAKEALDQARINIADVDSGRIALLFGTSMGEHAVSLEAIAQRVADALGIRGPCCCFSSACVSSTNAIGAALDWLALPTIDTVVAGGSDVLTPLMHAGFNALGILSEQPCAPFSEPPGTTLGEGAAFLVVERARTFEARGVTPVARLEGYGLAADAYHDTGPEPRGSGVAVALRQALRHAGVGPADVSYLNMHATGTAANDPAEWQGVRRVFGSRAESLPVSGTKSIVGHAQGAAGGVESVVTLLGMMQDVLPPTLNVDRPRPHSPPDPVARRSRAHRITRAMCTNSAFGGANAAVVFSRPQAPREQSARRRRPVYWAGGGLVSPWADRTDLMLEALLSGSPPPSLKAPRPNLRTVARTLDGRGLDGSTCMLTAAVGQAALAAGVSLRGGDRARIGLVSGITRVSPESAARLHESVERRGLPLLSATAFARMVLNAPTGTTARLLSFRGPTSTVTCGHGSGLLAAIYAAMLLSDHECADRIVAGSVDEVDVGGATAGNADGASAAMLQTSPTSIQLNSWGLAGPGQPALAVAAACRTSVRIDAQFGGTRPYACAPTYAVPESWGRAEASHSLWLLLCGAEWLARNEGGSMLVVADRSASTSMACVLSYRGQEK